jgi:diamine N-acetyltransferase
MPVHGKSPVSLREVTRATLPEILSLSVKPEQAHLVATNAQSIAEAYFCPEAWFRAIYVDETPVGFLMLHDENLKDHPERDDFYYLWRMMIDARFQAEGFGRRALSLLIDHVKTRPNAETLLTSCHPGPENAEAFYRRCGFVSAEGAPAGEVGLALSLQSATNGSS